MWEYLKIASIPKALAIGRWNAPATLLGIELHTHLKILGVTFGSSLEEATK
jgi:hypothetical protein